jgi:hypothetical protein
MSISIEGLQAIVQDWRHVQVSGNVLGGGDSPAVIVSGITAGSVSCDGGGGFLFEGDCTALGEVAVRATDGQGAFSETVFATASLAAPAFAASLTDLLLCILVNGDRPGMYRYSVSGRLSLPFRLPEGADLPASNYQVMASCTVDNQAYSVILPVEGGDGLPNDIFTGTFGWPFQLPCGTADTIDLSYTDPFGRTCRACILFGTPDPVAAEDTNNGR